MKLRRILAVLSFLLWPALAMAQQTHVNDLPSSIAVTTISGNCLAANPNRVSLSLDNRANTVAVGYCEAAPVPAGQPATACTAAIGSGGTSTLAGGSLDYWRAGSGPTNMFCFIAASGTQTITVREGF